MRTRRWMLLVVVAACGSFPRLNPIGGDGGGTDGDGGGSDGASGTRYRRAITIAGAEVTNTLTAFPVLIRMFGDAGLVAHASHDGSDVRFTLQDGTTVLDHQLEHFDGAAGDLVAWVAVPELAAGADTHLYLVYAGVPMGTPNPAAVWDSGYLGVWHLDDTSTQIVDSTAHHFDGSKFSPTAPSSVAQGVIAAAEQFAGTGAPDRIDLSSNSLSFELTTLTIECWASLTADNTNSVSRIVDLPAGYLSIGYPNLLNSSNHYAVLFGYAGSNFRQSAETSLPEGVAHHLAVEINSNTLVDPWIDGLQQSTTSAPQFTESNTTVTFGNDGGGAHGIRGVLDEVRISSVLRTAAWIAAEYANQKSNSTFVTIGTEQAF